MQTFKGKKGIIMGVANERSIAAALSQKLSLEGASIGYSHLPDDKGRMAERVRKVVGNLDPQFLEPCDVNKDSDIDAFFAKAREEFTTIDFLAHSIAFAPVEDIRCNTVEASRAGFLTAMESSVYSFIAVCKRAAELMPNGGSIVTMTYFGGEKVVAGYNLMGVAKAALDAAVRYLAYDLGVKNIRVNAISAGPLKTLAASAVGDFKDMLNMNAAIAPLQRNVTQEQVADAGAFLLSDSSAMITGEIMHVDAGYNIMGSPGRAFDIWGFKPREKDVT